MMIVTILRVVVFIFQSSNVKRVGENSKILVSIIDRCNWYSGRSVLSEPWYLTVFRSLVPIIVVVGISIISTSSLILLSISISVPL